MHRLFPVDTAVQTMRCEPNVPMDALVAHTLPAGLIPKIVLESKGITVGGGYSGMFGESSMFRYGLFQNTIREIDIVLGDGTLETASRHRHPDPLEHAGGSLGTFGIVTLLTVELMPAQPYVNLHVQAIAGADVIVPAMEAAVTRDPAYVDGTYFGADRIVLTEGSLSDAPARPPLKKLQVHWFAAHVEASCPPRPAP